jgi:phage-related protein
VVWPVVYYRAPDGSEPVNDTIDRLPPRVQVVIDNQIDRLAIFGPDLGYPYTSQIEGELRELRCHFGANLYRILYRRSQNLFVLLHMLPKRTVEIPPEDVRTAQDRWADFVRRMNERPRRRPRAAGQDAT